MSNQNKPKAVIISDVHYSHKTLEVADAAYRMAIDTAAMLKVPLIDAGDLTNDKSILRAEVVNRLLTTVDYAFSKGVDIFALVGNHSLCNEKGEEHALHFLEASVHIISSPVSIWGFNFIPYQNTQEKMVEALKKFPKGSEIIIHQGLMGANMGDYVQDKTSLDKEVFADYRIISGHYHRKQDIKCGRPRKGAVGLFSYLGNPYTLTFGEANDGPKGFHVLLENGLLEFIPTDLRKHYVANLTLDGLRLVLAARKVDDLNPNDFLWLKVQGPYSELQKLDKRAIGMKLLGHANYKLDKIPTDAVKVISDTQKLTGEQILDNLIDATAEEPGQKSTLKKLWREIL